MFHCLLIMTVFQGNTLEVKYLRSIKLCKTKLLFRNLTLLLAAEFVKVDLWYAKKVIVRLLRCELEVIFSYIVKLQQLPRTCLLLFQKTHMFYPFFDNLSSKISSTFSSTNQNNSPKSPYIWTLHYALSFGLTTWCIYNPMS